jgi:glutathione S-transferase
MGSPRVVAWLVLGRQGGPYVCGDAFSHADLMAFPFIFRMSMLLKQ